MPSASSNRSFNPSIWYDISASSFSAYTPRRAYSIHQTFFEHNGKHIVQFNKADCKNIINCMYRFWNNVNVSSSTCMSPKSVGTTVLPPMCWVCQCPANKNAFSKCLKTAPVTLGLRTGSGRLYHAARRTMEKARRPYKYSRVVRWLDWPASWVGSWVWNDRSAKKLQAMCICNFVPSISTAKFVLQFGTLFLWQANCCSIYVGSVGCGLGLIWSPQVHRQLDGLVRSVIWWVGLGWAGTIKTDPSTTLGYSPISIIFSGHL